MWSGGLSKPRGSNSSMKMEGARVSDCAKRNASLGLGLSTIVDFEGRRQAMQKALEKAGIQFIAKNCRDERPASKIRSKMRVRWFV
jgi:hypothetical protein